MVGGVVGYGMSLYIGNHVGSIEVVDMLTGELIRDMPTTAGTSSAGMPIVNWAGYHIGGSTHWGRIRQKAQLMEMFTPYGK